MWCFLFACEEPPPPVVVESVVVRLSYDEERARLDEVRAELFELPRAQARERARKELTEGFRSLAEHWVGTPWEFYGQTQTPGEGSIACGYFVSTVLSHLELQVERVHMAQQASELIVKTFAEDREIARFRGKPASDVVDWVQQQPDGLYAAGFDYHVGMLVKRGAKVEFCHSSFVNAEGVVCSDPLEDVGFASRYRVVGPVLTDAVLDAWLESEPIATYRSKR